MELSSNAHWFDSTKACGIGGIGYGGKVTNCYFTGRFNVKYNGNNPYNYDIITIPYTIASGLSQTITNCHYEDLWYEGTSSNYYETITPDNGAARNLSVMKQPVFVNILNNSQNPAEWVADGEPYQNDGLPILAWQLSTSTSIKDNVMNDMNIYVADRRLNISIPNITGAASTNIYSISGQLIFTENDTAEGYLKKTIPLETYSAGIYLIEITNNTRSYTKKVFIK